MNNLWSAFKEEGQRVPVKCWDKEVVIDSNAKQQAQELANLPFVYKHLALMPDAHLGKGACIGSVLATKDAIIPAAVGVDIGCGMLCRELGIHIDQLKEAEGGLESIYERIREMIPTGNAGWNFASQKKLKDSQLMQSLHKKHWDGIFIDKLEGIGEGLRLIYQGKNIGENNAAVGSNLSCEQRDQIDRTMHSKNITSKGIDQLGTLGSGNHFIELAVNSEGSVFLLIHSGSRGLGHWIATEYIKWAKWYMKTWFIDIDKELSYFIPYGCEHYNKYIYAVEWAQEYAKRNRAMMAEIVEWLLASLMIKTDKKEDAIDFDCHHNYITKENHFGENVWVTRKGAIRARIGDWGLIPGSMGSYSYIVKGKGNAESFNSAAHGAGRAMSRTQAKKQFTIQEHIQDTQGVICRQDNKVLDETPKAYKNIDDVIKSHLDCIAVVDKVKQVLCVKG